MSTSGVRRGLPNPDNTQSTSTRPRRFKRGERRRLTREDTNVEIRRLEEELANLLVARNALKKEQRDQRAATLEAYKAKDQNQVDVNRSYKDISTKSEEMNRIKAGLIYQQPQRHDDAIRRIEGQLHVNNFKMSDEKRLVQEIDALRKSKRDLTKYQAMRASLDEMRAKQRALKSQRDALFEKIKASKKKEDELKRRLEELLSQINQMKRTIEELQQRRQQLDVAASSSSGDEGEAAGVGGGSVVAGGAAGTEVASIEIEPDDFVERVSEAEELVTLCRSLIAYLRSFRADWAAVAAAGDSCGGDSGGAGRRAGARKLQRSERSLKHPPNVFAQFYRLSIQPPTRAAEVPDCLQRLNAALDANAAESGPEARDKSPGPSAAQVGYARSLSNPSNDESGFSETTSVRPESPETRVAQAVPEVSSGPDDLLSTSSTICSEENPASSATESPPAATA